MLQHLFAGKRLVVGYSSTSIASKGFCHLLRSSSNKVPSIHSTKITSLLIPIHDSMKSTAWRSMPKPQLGCWGALALTVAKLHWGPTISEFSCILVVAVLPFADVSLLKHKVSKRNIIFKFFTKSTHDKYLQISTTNRWVNPQANPQVCCQCAERPSRPERHPPCKAGRPMWTSCRRSSPGTKWANWHLSEFDKQRFWTYDLSTNIAVNAVLWLPLSLPFLALRCDPYERHLTMDPSVQRFLGDLSIPTAASVQENPTQSDFKAKSSQHWR